MKLFYIRDCVISRVEDAPFFEIVIVVLIHVNLAGMFLKMH
jgi:hypothetical protein